MAERRPLPRTRVSCRNTCTATVSRRTGHRRSQRHPGNGADGPTNRRWKRESNAIRSLRGSSIIGAKNASRACRKSSHVPSKERPCRLATTKDSSAATAPASVLPSAGPSAPLVPFEASLPSHKGNDAPRTMRDML
eukprot:scaffold529_cov308-Pinguiococcus_pyrenoidosus.AAC.37